jgi:hypothetical protein
VDPAREEVYTLDGGDFASSEPTTSEPPAVSAYGG